MSSHFIIDTLQDIFETAHVDEEEAERAVKMQNQQEMGSGIKTFITQLANYSNLHFNQFSNFMSPQRMVRGLLSDYLTNSLHEKGIYDSAGFVDRGDHCQINALVYGSVLGDIFYYLMVEEAIRLQAPLNMVRMVVLTRAPKGQPMLAPDGQVEFAATRDGSRPYYMQIYNMELIGANYDFELDSIVDQSQENANGYKTYMTLYAAVAIINVESDEYARYVSKKLVVAERQNAHKTRVPAGHVPVGLQIGGYVKPYALLPNKTGLSDRQWMQRSPYFGVKFM